MRRADNRICSVTGCGRQTSARGLCMAHWQRLRNSGDVRAHIPIGRARDGALNIKWKGGIQRSRGRTYIHAPEHPFANAHGTVARHRLVMEQALGRYLKPGEVVHHLGSLDEDTPDKLVVTSQTEHCRAHFAKTSVETVVKIREMAKTMKPAQIATELNVPIRRVRAIVGRETWKDLEMEMQQTAQA